MNATSCYVGPLSLGGASPCFGGTCDEATGSCICSEGWSSNTYMVPLRLPRSSSSNATKTSAIVLGCPTNVLATQILWSIGLALALISLLVIPRALNEQRIIARRKLPGAPFLTRAWKHTPLFVLITESLATLPAVLAIVFMGLLHRDYAVGIHFGVSLAFAVYWVSLFSLIPMADRHVMESAVLTRATGEQKAQMNVRAVAKEKVRVIYPLCGWVAVGCTVPVVPSLLTLPQEESSLASNDVFEILSTPHGSWNMVFMGMMAIGCTLQILKCFHLMKAVTGMFAVLLAFPLDAPIRKQVVRQRNKMLRMHRIEAAGWCSGSATFCAQVFIPSLWTLNGYFNGVHVCAGLLYIIQRQISWSREPYVYSAVLSTGLRARSKVKKKLSKLSFIRSSSGNGSEHSASVAPYPVSVANLSTGGE